MSCSSYGTITAAFFPLFSAFGFAAADRLDKKVGPAIASLSGICDKKSRPNRCGEFFIARFLCDSPLQDSSYSGALGRRGRFVLCGDSGGAVFSALWSGVFLSLGERKTRRWEILSVRRSLSDLYQSTRYSTYNHARTGFLRKI